MLHQLKNGDWVNLAAVTGVAERTTWSVNDYSFKPTVCVMHGGCVHEIGFDNKEQAVAYRDELASLANGGKPETIPELPSDPVATSDAVFNHGVSVLASMPLLKGPEDFAKPEPPAELQGGYDPSKPRGGFF